MVNLMSSATHFDDVWVSLSLKICCPKWPFVFWENYDGPVPKNPVDLVSEEQTVGDG